MESNVSLPFSQQLAARSQHKPDTSTPHANIQLLCDQLYCK